MNWIDIKRQKPVCFESGDWDGLRSDFVLVFDKKGNYFIARAYEGDMYGNGQKVLLFFDRDDFEIFDVIFWAKLIEPLY